MREGSDKRPPESDTAATVRAAPDDPKKEAIAAAVQVTAAAVAAVPDELKKDVTAAAVAAVPDELKKDVTAAAVAAVPDELKDDVTVAAMQAVPNEMKDSAAAAAVEAVLSAKDSEHSDLAETVARAVRDEVRKGVRKELRKELRGPSLINYEGYLGIYVVGEDGHRLKINEDRSIPMRRGGRYSLVLIIGAVADGSVDLTLPLRISGGVDAEQVEFTVILDGDDPGLRQPPQSVTVATASGSTSSSFPLEARSENPARLWLRVAQRGEFIQHVELKVPRLAGG